MRYYLIILTFLLGCKCKQEAKPVTVSPVEVLEKRLDSLSKVQAQQTLTDKRQDSLLKAQHETKRAADKIIYIEAKTKRDEKINTLPTYSNDSLRGVLAN